MPNGFFFGIAVNLIIQKLKNKHLGSFHLHSRYRGSPTSSVSTSTDSTTMIFSAIGIKVVLVEFPELAM